jgi:hypothetical protein
MPPSRLAVESNWVGCNGGGAFVVSSAILTRTTRFTEIRPRIKAAASIPRGVPVPTRSSRSIPGEGGAYVLGNAAVTNTLVAGNLAFIDGGGLYVELSAAFSECGFSINRADIGRERGARGPGHSQP